ncbi:MAG: N-acetylmuramoyl-L-alanine amidase, partial [Candidatus Riesia sp.]|nr:N-acetylmuramoyl-L-alanine amidase [Candidatus Riesia sp.]
MNIYEGLVENVDDPKRNGRIKVRVASIYDQLHVDDIPWASPLKSPDGRTFSLPSIGKVVSIIFPFGNIYSPYYINSEIYNINLKNRLDNIGSDDYANFTALLYDHRTQIYSDENELKLDYYFNNISIDNGSINLDLKNNNNRINLGDRDSSSQQALFGNHWLEWFDKFVEKLLLPTSLTGNLSAPVLKPEIDQLLVEYKAIRETFLSNNVYLVDNNNVVNQNESKRDYETISMTHDVDLKYNKYDIIDIGIITETGYIDSDGNFISTNKMSSSIKNNIINKSISEYTKTNQSLTQDPNIMDDNAFLDPFNLEYEGSVSPDYENRMYQLLDIQNKIFSDGTPISGSSSTTSNTEIDKSFIVNAMNQQKDKLKYKKKNDSSIDYGIYYYKGTPFVDKNSSQLEYSIPARNLNIKIEDFGLEIIRGYQLGRHKYSSTDNPKNKIFLHHTNGNGNPINVFHGWNSTDNLVSTPYIIGGYDIKDQSFKHNGKIYQFYPENGWSWTSGVGGGKKERYIIAVELCNYGYLFRRNGKWRTSWGNAIPDDQVYSLEDSPYEMKSFMGYTHFQKYFPEQIESLRKLLEYLIKRYNIRIEENIYHTKGYWNRMAKAFDVNTSG